MSKSYSFSIYLLKQGYDSNNSLKEDHQLQVITAQNLPSGAELYLLDSIPKPPWWRDYFGISKPLSQGSKGAIIFLPISNRFFALSFGYVAHHLKDISYEYDFGLRVSLNCLDPDKLKSTDTVEPGTSRRQRTQLPVGSNLTYFDFDRDNSIIKSLAGKVKDEYEPYFRNTRPLQYCAISFSTSVLSLK